MSRPSKSRLHGDDAGSGDEISIEAKAAQERSRNEMFLLFEETLSFLSKVVRGEDSDHEHKCADCGKVLASAAEVKLADRLMGRLLPYVQRQLPQTLDIRHSKSGTVERTSELQDGFLSIAKQLPESVLVPLGFIVIQRVGMKPFLALNEAPVDVEVVEKKEELLVEKAD